MSAYESYKALFLHPKIAPLNQSNEEPRYKKIEAATIKLNANAAVIH